MHNRMKKCISLLLAMTMVLCMGNISFADSAGTATVSAVASETEFEKSSEAQTATVKVLVDEQISFASFKIAFPETDVDSGLTILSSSAPICSNHTTKAINYASSDDVQITQKDGDKYLLGTINVQIDANAVGEKNLKLTVTASNALGSKFDVVGSPITVTFDIAEPHTCSADSCTKTDAVAATCQAAGNQAYWTCDQGDGACGKVYIGETFADAYAAGASSVAAATIAKTGHNWLKYDGTNGDSFDDSTEMVEDHTYCTVCNVEQTGYEMYWKIDDADAETGLLAVPANADVTAKIIVKPSAAIELSTIYATLTYPESLTLSSVVPSPDIECDTTTAGKIKFADYSIYPAKTIAKDAEFEVATVTFHTAEDFSAQADLSFEGTPTLACRGDLEDHQATTDDGSTGFTPKKVNVSLKNNETDEADLKKDDVSYTALPEGVEGAAMTLESPDNPSGRTFIGWSTAKDGSIITTPTVYPTGDADGNYTYYAQFSKNSVTMSIYYYNNAEAKAYTGSSDDAVDSAVTTLDTNVTGNAEGFYKPGWKFKEWTVTPDGGTAETAENLPEKYPSVSTTYFAVYEKVEYTLTYDANGGDDIENVTYDIESTATLATPTRTGYTFHGWKVTSASAGDPAVGCTWTTDEEYAAGTALTGKYGNVTLQAQWVRSGSVTFEEYAYAKTGDVLVIISGLEAPAEGKGYAFDSKELFKVVDDNYGGTVYVSLVTYSDYEALTADELMGKISDTTTANTEIAAANRGDINNSGTFTPVDASTIYQLIKDKTNYDENSDLTVLGRLKADASTSEVNAYQRGSLEDAATVAGKIS